MTVTLEQMQDAIRIPLMDLHTENWSPKTLDKTYLIGYYQGIQKRRTDERTRNDADCKQKR